MSDTKEKWKIGNLQSTVVSNKKQKNEFFPVQLNPSESKDEEVEYYGGYLVCESIGNSKARNLISAAPEMLEMLMKVNDKLLSFGGKNVPLRIEIEQLIKKVTE